MASLVKLGQRVFTSLGSFPERRLHNRARAIWEASRRENPVPRYEDFDLRRMADLSEQGFLLEIGADRTPQVTYVGADGAIEVWLRTPGGLMYQA